MKQLQHIRSCMQKTHPRHTAWHKYKQNNFNWPGVYDRYITGIFMSYVSNSLGSGMLAPAGPTGLPGAFCRSTPAPLADLLRFSNRETGNTQLGPAKVPKPSVDLIYMAASALSLARSVSTAEFEVPTLSRTCLEWWRWCCHQGSMERVEPCQGGPQPCQRRA